MQEQFKEVQALIRVGQLEEARDILKTIDHPKAREWLQKVEEKLAQSNDERFYQNLNQSLPPQIPVYYTPPPPPPQASLTQNGQANGYTGVAKIGLGILGITLAFLFMLPATIAFVYGTIRLFAAESGDINPTFAVAWYLLALILGKAGKSLVNLLK